MITNNPFSTLAEIVPAIAMQGFVIAMAALTLIGVLVDIVHKKLTDVLGISSCLYLANSYERRKSMRAVIQDLVSQSLDLMNQLAEREERILSDKVNSLIEERLDYAKKIRIYESELKNFYTLNIDAVDHRENLEKNWNYQLLWPNWWMILLKSGNFLESL